MLPPLMASEQHRIGRYTVLTPISKGGMAELFLAYVDGPGGFRKFVAVKRILPQLREDEDFIAMFLDEARISAALSHANIAQVFELGEDADALYLAMEYIAGQDLSRMRSALRRQGAVMPVGLAVKVAHETCLAVHYAHHFTSPGGRPLPVIHRDLSPRNVMVTYAGNVKVIDFGIAKARGSLSTTREGNIKGSIAYMSPEQLRGEPLDGRSDLFTIGSVLYELLTGERAFNGDDDPAIMYRVLTHDPPPATEKRAEVPAALSAVLTKAMSKQRDERYASGRDMAKAIEDACGADMFDEGDIARWMGEHFTEQMERTRQVLALADAEDSRRIVSAANRLREAKDRDVTLGAAERPTMASAHPPIAPHAALAESTVLVVDDSKVGRALVETVLKAAGATVVPAASAEECLEMLVELRPNVIILDVRMPGMDGFELCSQLRRRTELRSTAILFLSAACSLEERVKGLSVGGDDFIRKPFEGSELVARVRAHAKRVALLKPLEEPPPSAPAS